MQFTSKLQIIRSPNTIPITKTISRSILTITQNIILSFRCPICISLTNNTFIFISTYKLLYTILFPQYISKIFLLSSSLKLSITHINLSETATSPSALFLLRRQIITT
ncbi:hypothetical protein DF16_pBMB2062orf00002 (plasmid) [Bacillus thuringiensis serovar kurstaki str. YBT-1520]|nr:hypothetical protein DF16_pBMB2062orf00002 [Bacillus thuringiensis serovar kurstaki str. YBT-1520]